MSKFSEEANEIERESSGKSKEIVTLKIGMKEVLQIEREPMNKWKFLKIKKKWMKKKARIRDTVKTEWN